MNLLKAITAGFLGSMTLNFLHQRSTVLSQKTANPINVDELIDLDSFNQINQPIVDDRTDYGRNLLSNIISNTLFFSTIGFGKPRNFYFRGLSLGLAAGISAITFSERENLEPTQVDIRQKSNVKTTAMYVIGSLVTASFLSLFKNSK